MPDNLNISKMRRSLCYPLLLYCLVHLHLFRLLLRIGEGALVLPLLLQRFDWMN